MPQASSPPPEFPGLIVSSGPRLLRGRGPHRPNRVPGLGAAIAFGGLLAWTASGSFASGAVAGFPHPTDTAAARDPAGADSRRDRPGLRAFPAASRTEAGENGVVRGTVTLLQTGDPVAGAVIRITGADAAATTDERGAFEITGLAPGSYEVLVEHESLPPARQPVTVAPGAAATADFALQLAVRENVSVRAEPGGYRTDAATIGKIPVPILDAPASIRVIDRRLLEDQAAADADEVHRNIAGITSSPYASIVARGFTQRDFLFNGVRGNPYGSLGGDVNNSGFSVSQLQLTNIERIEVLRGPASVLYGSAEPGGVMNYVTRKPQEVSGARATLRFGQYDQLYGSGEITGPVGDSGRLLYRLAAYANERESFRANARMENTHLAGNLDWIVSDRTRLGFEYENIGQELQGHRLRGVPVDGDGNFLTDIEWTATEPNDFTNLDAHVFQLRWDQALPGGWTLDSTLRYLEYDRAEQYHEPRRINPDNTVQREFRDQQRTNDDIAAVLNVNRTVRTDSTVHRFLFGADLFRQDHLFRYGRARQSGNGGPVPDLHLFEPEYGRSRGSDYGLTPDSFAEDTVVARQLGVFAQDHLEIGDALHLLLGARLTVYEDSGASGGNTLEGSEQGITSRAGVVYKPRDAWSLYGSYSTSFNRPSILAQTASANGPHDPETARQFELGVKTEVTDALSVTAAAFTITKQNVLRPDPEYGPDGNNWNAVLQVGEARNRGLELELLGALTPGWDLSLNYTYLDSTIVRDPNPGLVGEPLPNAAPHSLGLFTRFDLLRQASAGVGVTHVAERLEPYAGIRAPAFTVVDLHLYRRLGRFGQVHLRLENLFDTVYATSSLFAARAGNFPGQPRTLSILLTLGTLR